MTRRTDRRRSTTSAVEAIDRLEPYLDVIEDAIKRIRAMAGELHDEERDERRPDPGGA